MGIMGGANFCFTANYGRIGVSIRTPARGVILIILYISS